MSSSGSSPHPSSSPNADVEEVGFVLVAEEGFCGASEERGSDEPRELTSKGEERPEEAV
jgi:hypothetical protein